MRFLIYTVNASNGTFVLIAMTDNFKVAEYAATEASNGDRLVLLMTDGKLTNVKIPLVEKQ